MLLGIVYSSLSAEHYLEGCRLVCVLLRLQNQQTQPHFFVASNPGLFSAVKDISSDAHNEINTAERRPEQPSVLPLVKTKLWRALGQIGHAIGRTI